MSSGSAFSFLEHSKSVSFFSARSSYTPFQLSASLDLVATVIMAERAVRG